MNGDSPLKMSMDIVKTSVAIIPGLSYFQNYLTAREQATLLTAIDEQPWPDDLQRRVQQYGYKYDYKRRSVNRSLALGPLPEWARVLAEQLVHDGVMPACPDQLIVNEYLPGQGIASHIDCEPCFGDVICSLSLGSSCTMVMAHARDGRQEQIRLVPGSLLVLSDEARYAWRHGIPARLKDTFEGEAIRRGRRVSLTFRTVILQDN